MYADIQHRLSVEIVLQACSAFVKLLCVDRLIILVYTQTLFQAFSFNGTMLSTATMLISYTLSSYCNGL